MDTRLYLLQKLSMILEREWREVEAIYPEAASYVLANMVKLEREALAIRTEKAELGN